MPGVRSLCDFSLPLGISNGGWAGEERRPTHPGGGQVGKKDLPSQPMQLSSWPLGYSCRAVERAEVGSPLPVGPQDCTHCLLFQRVGLWILRAPSPLERTEQNSPEHPLSSQRGGVSPGLCHALLHDTPL